MLVEEIEYIAGQPDDDSRRILGHAVPLRGNDSVRLREAMTQVTDTGGRDGVRSPEFNESQPFMEFIVTVLRYLPLVVSCGVLVGVAAFVLTTPEPPEPAASSQVGLTQQVVWPFYDTARQRAVTVAEEPQFAEELALRTGRDFLSVEVSAPDSQAYILLEVTASTTADAAVAADAAADLLLERDTARLAQTTEAELATVTRLLDASQARTDAIDARLDELVPAEATARANVSDDPSSAAVREEVLRAELERASLQEVRNEELRRQVSLQLQKDEAEAAVTTVVPELEILKRADAPEQEPERSYIPVIAASAAAVIAGFALAIMWDRSRGPLASRWHAEQVAGVPVLADMGSRRQRERAVGLFLTSLLEGAATHGKIVALTGLRGVNTDMWLAMAMKYFQLAGIDVIAVAEARSTAVSLGMGRTIEWSEVHDPRVQEDQFKGISTILLPRSLTLLDAAIMRPTLQEIATGFQLVLISGGVLGDPESDQAIAFADSTALIARKNFNRVDQLRGAARQIRIRKTAFLGVVIGTSRLPTPNRSRTPAEQLLAKKSSTVPHAAL